MGENKLGNVVCRLCSSCQLKILFEREFKVLLCRNCGLIFLDNIYRDHKKYYSQEYSYGLVYSSGREQMVFIENQIANIDIVKWVLETLPDKKDIDLLEIGCSAGFLLKRFKEHKINVSGIETNKKAVAFARNCNATTLASTF
jgi:SAM-dependent methyltransferase